MKKFLLALAVAAPIVGFSQWKTTSLGNSTVKEGKEKIESAGLYSLDTQVLKQQLANAPVRFSNLPGNIISLPNAAGKMESYEVWEASNFAPGLQARFPEIRSYVGIGIDDPNAYLRFSVSPSGISTMTLRGGKSEFIEPYTVDGSKYIVFDSKAHRNQGNIPFECSTPETSALVNDSEDLINANKSSAGVFKTFRLAQSVTGEYTQYFGGTVAQALAGINNTITRVNGVFEKDFALQLILIDNTDDVIYTDPNTDPYSPPTGMNNWNSQLQNTLNTVIGAANYDIGHLFGRSGGGGNAGCIGCICSDSNKGSGITSPGQGGPEGDNFDIDYVAHEMGHQMGANHTFTFGYEGTSAQVEPGSGSTIMGYAGITNYNVQQHSDDYFTYKSILQVQTNLQSKPCANNTTLTNGAPTVDAGIDYNIPKSTAFVLRGSATDPNGDTLEYTWEQNDVGNSGTTDANSRVNFTKTSGPNFRSFPYVSEPVRYVPKFEYVLSRDISNTENIDLAYWRSKWEAASSVQRQLNFTLTARDNNSEGGQTNTDAMKVIVKDAGPFKVTNPIQDQDISLNTNTMLVEWDVAGTDGGDINTANVKISLSTDNGNSFTVLKESTPNDGSETVTIPTGTVATTNCRILIEAVGNIYYAVSRPFKFSGTMGVSDVNNNMAIGIYPNPSNGQFFVRASAVSKGDVKTTIFDTAGRTVYTQTKNHNGGSLEQSYNVKLPTGVYVVVIESADGKTTDKLVIK